MARAMRLISWNVNGLRAIHRHGDFMDWLTAESPDVLCLQEIKSLEEQLPPELKSVDGYHAYFNPAERKGYSGVAIYTKQEPLDVISGIGVPEFDVEGRVIIAEYPTFTLLNIYYPNGKMNAERLAYKMRFYDAFLGFVDGLKNAGQNLVICGDVNTAHTEADIARPKENAKISGFLPEERAWMDDFFGHGYVDTFRMFDDRPAQYSFWDMKSRARERDVGWRIDYFFVNDGFKANVTNAWIRQDVMGSDHCPIGIDLDA
jgi:exodeoxyribonuclease-3